MKFLIAFMSCAAFGQVAIVDTLFTPQGGRFSGRIEVVANCAITIGSQSFTRWQQNYAVSSSGSLSISLYPTDPAQTAQCSTPGYTVRYFPNSAIGNPNISSYTERWIVPAVAGPLKIADIRPPAGPGTDKCWSWVNGTGWTVVPCPAGSQYIEVPFSSSTTWTVPATTHNFGTDNLAVETRNTLGALVQPGLINVSSTGVVTINWFQTQIGTVRIYKSTRNHRVTLSNTSSFGVAPATHGLKGISWIVCRYANGDLFLTSPVTSLEVIGSSISTAMAVNINFPAPVSGRCDLMGE